MFCQGCGERFAKHTVRHNDVLAWLCNDCAMAVHHAQITKLVAEITPSRGHAGVLTPAQRCKARAIWAHGA